MPELKWDAKNFWVEQDFQTSTRLHLQHWIFTHQLGYLLHPDIDQSEPLKIADVACGNAAWILDLQRAHPEHEYHGLDINPRIFPAAELLPKNVQLHELDAFADLPDEYKNAFDIVDIRTIYSAIIDNKVEPLLTNLLAMLKPGGYLQWAENDFHTLAVHTIQGGKAEALETIVNIQKFFAVHQTKMSSDWLLNLPRTLEQRRCKVLVEEHIKPFPSLARAWSDNNLSVFLGVISLLPEQEIPLPSVPGLPKTLSRKILAELVMQGAKEASSGAWVSMEQRVVVVQKAS
ncbi:hypothetical protein LTR78_000305 [Recurvomyces mirabilis]|uniref:Methyltransferase domain-containing protein n=1 Tax=Recurvomyces mirabilis TaxID=574656 RepID=A0AAE0WXS6_9PEZI|nr:hypothetical protein LTR78_000305 [Recurvomyces mirabilis]KAK5161960.1 hypothetical protein LTS14_000306 [Recurvomyces mirabilis]